MADYNPMKYALIKIFDGNIVINGSPIEVLDTYPPENEIDCISFKDRPGNTEDNLLIADVFEPLPADHPYYDPENPDETYAVKEEYSETLKGIMDVHVWCNDGAIRDNIVNQIRTVLKAATMFNYQYCFNYEKATQHCITTDAPCDALTVNNHLGIKGICPYADVTDSNSSNWRNPSTYFDLVNVDIYKVKMREEQNVDDLSTNPVTIHSVLPVNYEVQIITEVDVNPVCDVGLTNDLEILEPSIFDYKRS